MYDLDILEHGVSLSSLSTPNPAWGFQSTVNTMVVANAFSRYIPLRLPRTFVLGTSRFTSIGVYQ